MKWISLVLSIVSLIVSIMVLATFWPVESMDFDYIGAIVGVLSFLVTLLMGYQIYTVINVKDSLKEVQQIRDEIDEKIQEKTDAITNDFKEELYQATPLIMAIASTKKDVIECEVFKAYKNGKPKQLAKDLAGKTILIILQGIVRLEDPVEKKNILEQLSSNVNYDEVVEFYTDFAKRNDKSQYKGVEPLLLELIATLSEKSDGNKN